VESGRGREGAQLKGKEGRGGMSGSRGSRATGRRSIGERAAEMRPQEEGTVGRLPLKQL
jgi:hypothetical protein